MGMVLFQQDTPNNCSNEVQKGLNAIYMRERKKERLKNMKIEKFGSV